MFAVEVRDHVMVAHSFRGEMFGPAQALHGATFVIDAAFMAETLDPNGIVIDIGRAHAMLKEILNPLNYKNLDDVPEFKGKNTTTEFLCRWKHIPEKRNQIRSQILRGHSLVCGNRRSHRFAIVGRLGGRKSRDQRALETGNRLC